MKKLHATQVLKRPLVTEKCTAEADEHNRYSFEVDRRATKPEIKAAIEEVYSVRVVAVATQMRKGVYRRTKTGENRSSDWKKATVQIHEEDRIELF